MKGFFTTAAALLACLPLLGPVHTAGADDLAPELASSLKVPAEAGDAGARGWLEKAAAQGLGQAQLALGAMFYYGQFVPQDYVKARYWFEKAATQGLAEAQLCLGLMCKEGQGGPQDDVQARSWFEKAAAQGHPRARQFLDAMDKEGL